MIDHKTYTEAQKERIQWAYLDAVNGVKKHWEELEIGFNAFGLSPSQQVIRYCVHREQPLDEHFTLYVYDTSNQWHKFNEVEIAADLNHAEMIWAVSDVLFQWMNAIVASSDLMDFIWNNPIKGGITKYMMGELTTCAESPMQ